MMIIFRNLGIQPYTAVWEKMKQFTASRDKNTQDEIWLLEHTEIYTQGQAGKAEHILNQLSIPIVHTDRGGQITYHGPGQLMAYVLMDINRRKYSVRTLVSHLEQIIIDLLFSYNIIGERRCGAPGIYVQEKKIASLGLRIKNGCSYHGLALNVSMDLRPFANINPCGIAELKMTQMQENIPQIKISEVRSRLAEIFLNSFE